MRSIIVALATLSLVPLVPSALAQSRQPAQITSIPSVTPQRFDILDKTGSWIPMGAIKNGVYLDASRAISPVAYGAKCDGVTDDTAALQAWAAAATAQSYMVVPGVCIFKSKITFAPVFGVTLAGQGEPGELRYAGTSTTTDLIQIGYQYGLNCGIRGWAIKGLRVMSDTTMTAGDALRISDSCAMEIEDISVGGNLENSTHKLWNAVHLDGGNTNHIVGATLQGQNDALKVHGMILPSNPGATPLKYIAFTEPMIYNAQIVHSKVGLHICGNVGGLNIDASDMLFNGTNVLIDQSCTAQPNTQVFFGPHFMSDMTGLSGYYPSEPQIGLHIADPGGPNTFITYRGWMATARKQCILIDDMPAPTSGEPQLHIIGATVGNCAPGAGQGSIQNDNDYYRISITSTIFMYNSPTEPEIQNISTGKPIVIQSIVPSDGYFDISGKWDGAYNQVNGSYRINTRDPGNIAMGVNNAPCGLWVGATSAFPGPPTGGAAGCTYGLGNGSFPFSDIWATTGHIYDTTTSDTDNFVIQAPNNVSGAVLKMMGNGATTPNKYIRARNGSIDIVSSDYSRAIFILNDDGDLITGGDMTISGTFKTAGMFISQLPSCDATTNVGMQAIIVNGVATPVYRAAVSTTGSTVSGVLCAGASGWLYH